MLARSLLARQCLKHPVTHRLASLAATRAIRLSDPSTRRGPNTIAYSHARSQRSASFSTSACLRTEEDDGGSDFFDKSVDPVTAEEKKKKPKQDDQSKQVEDAASSQSKKPRSTADSESALAGKAEPSANAKVVK
jgi:hypothetical protein